MYPNGTTDVNGNNINPDTRVLTPGTTQEISTNIVKEGGYLFIGSPKNIGGDSGKGTPRGTVLLDKKGNGEGMPKENERTE